MKTKRQKKVFSLKKQFYDSLRYISESRRYIYTSIILFVLSAIIGFLFHSKLSFLDDLIRGILETAQNLRGIDLIVFIFKNNLKASFYFLFLGIIFSIIPLINSITNGLLIGYIAEKVISSSSIIQLWRLLPHGIFELPAIFISAGLGIKLGISLTRLMSKEGKKEIKGNLRMSVMTFLLVIVPLLIIAAIIEGLLITFLD